MNKKVNKIIVILTNNNIFEKLLHTILNNQDIIGVNYRTNSICRIVVNDANGNEISAAIFLLSTLERRFVL